MSGGPPCPEPQSGAGRKEQRTGKQQVELQGTGPWPGTNTVQALTLPQGQPVWPVVHSETEPHRGPSVITTEAVGHSRRLASTEDRRARLPHHTWEGRDGLEFAPRSSQTEESLHTPGGGKRLRLCWGPAVPPQSDLLKRTTPGMTHSMGGGRGSRSATSRPRPTSLGQSGGYRPSGGEVGRPRGRARTSTLIRHHPEHVRSTGHGYCFSVQQTINAAHQTAPWKALEPPSRSRVAMLRIGVR